MTERLLASLVRCPSCDGLCLFEVESRDTVCPNCEATVMFTVPEEPPQGQLDLNPPVTVTQDQARRMVRDLIDETPADSGQLAATLKVEPPEC